MTRLTPPSCEAIKTFSVPVTFTSFVSTGCSTEYCTRGSAAQWKTNFALLIIGLIASRARISTLWKMVFGFRFSLLPPERLSITCTSYPFWTSASARCEPIKPAPPVMTTFTLPCFLLLGGMYSYITDISLTALSKETFQSTVHKVQTKHRFSKHKRKNVCEVGSVLCLVWFFRHCVLCFPYHDYTPDRDSNTLIVFTAIFKSSQNERFLR